MILQQYLDAAEQDRERYLQELTAYKKTEAYRLFTQKQASKKQKEESQDDVRTIINILKCNSYLELLNVTVITVIKTF